MKRALITPWQSSPGDLLIHSVFRLIRDLPDQSPLNHTSAFRINRPNVNSFLPVSRLQSFRYLLGNPGYRLNCEFPRTRFQSSPSPRRSAGNSSDFLYRIPSSLASSNQRIASRRLFSNSLTVLITAVRWYGLSKSPIDSITTFVEISHCTKKPLPGHSSLTEAISRKTGGLFV